MRTPTARSIVAAVLLVSSLLAPSIRSQETKTNDPKKKDQDVLKLKAELIQLDVVVTDKNNKPVPGLKKEDFELFDNKKRQNITHFSFEETRVRQVVQETEAPHTLPQAVTAREVKRVIAFVVDTMHMRYANVYRTRKVLEDFVDKRMEPGDLILIVATAGGSGLFQQFTSDQRVLLRAIDRLRPFHFGNEATPYRSLARMMAPLTRVAGPPPMVVTRSSVFNEIDPFEEADIRATLTTLDNVIRAMGKLPGRKISLFFSEGLRLFSTRTSPRLTETTARAARANVVFYTIDPRGLDPLVLEAGDDMEGKTPADFLSQKRDDFRESQDSLNAIAVDTGGKFYRDSNDIKLLFEKVMEENSSYYLLGFQPRDDNWDGKFHRLKVVVRGRPDLRVSTHKGYMARSEKAPVYEDPKIGEMVEAINSPLVRRDIDLRLTPFFQDDEKREPSLVTLLHIDTTKLTFKELDGKYKTSIELLGFLLGPNGRPVDQFNNTVELDLKPETYQAVLQRGLLSTRVAKVKHGIYQVRVLVREKDSGLIGTANNLIEIPNMKSDRLALSSIFLDARYDEKGERVADVKETETLAQRRYRKGGRFTYLLLIYNAKVDKTNQCQLELRSRILKGSSVVFAGEPRPIKLEDRQDRSRIATGGVMQLGEIPPGDYTLEISVKDRLAKKAERSLVRQEIDFSVE